MKTGLETFPIALAVVASSACVPGQWVGNGSYASSGTYAGGGAPPQQGGPVAEAPAPPPEPNLVATGAGKNVQRLTFDDNSNETQPALSRDGKWLLYAQRSLDDAATLRIMRSRADGGVSTIGVARLDGSELTNLVPGELPSWSPDGRRLVFQNQGQLYITDIEGGELTQIAFLSNRGWNRFAEADESVRNVYAMHSDGTGLVALTDGARHIEAASWGSDGRVYFASDDGGSWDLWRVDPDDAALDTAR